MPEAQKGFGDIFAPVKTPSTDKAKLLRPRTRRESGGPNISVVSDPVESSTAPETPVAAGAEEAAVTPQPASAEVEENLIASEQVIGAARSKGTYLPPDLLKLVKARTNDDVTYTDLLFDAFDAIDFEEVRKHFRPELNVGPSGIHRRVRRKRGTGSIQIQLRLDKVQEKWISDKVAWSGAPSRSAFVSYVFELFLRPEEG
ncbi:hypothetical protein DM794_06350 [Paenarthrobacter ureafaciens]|nr:hypothetical protein [Paenarthrobacter ureafaciens]